MRISFVMLATALAFAVLPAAAQGVVPVSAKDEMPQTAKPLDALFDALAKADSEETAKPIEDRILAMFNQSGSASIDLLMTRATASVQTGDIKTAAKLLGSITDLDPTFADGWFQRAQLQAISGDDEGAMISLQKAVTLNPRHFAALAQLAGLLEDYGNKPGALKFYRQAAKIDPHYDGIARNVRKLSREVEGDRI